MSATATIDLSPEQLKVVTHHGGHLQIIACAGSGKTESISRRIAALVDGGASPESIVAFTFTEKAAALTGISIVFIVVTATLLIATAEREINALWGVARARPLARTREGQGTPNNRSY